MEDGNVNQNFIQTVTVNLFNGIFSQSINFKNGLNLIAGANGTGKTQLLMHILGNRNNGKVTFKHSERKKDIAAFSPKRNAEKRSIEQAYDIIRKDPNARVSTLNAVRNINIQDNSYQTIKSITEYLASKAQDLVETNTPIVEAYENVEKEYQEILQKIFNYEISFTWNTKTRKPNSFLVSKRGYNLGSQQLSSGENALISLFFAIFDAKDEVPVYLIDEPEVHLNWQLEEKLFEALDWFCQTYNKQIIVVTHSRACFIEPFLGKTQFLVWENGKILSKPKPNEEIRSKLAGDLVKIIGGITTESKILHVEDEAQQAVLNTIKTLLNMSLEVKKLSGCNEVKKYSEVFKTLGVDNAYFLIDGDNSEVSTNDLQTKYCNLIQLKKYCIENYFLNENVLEQIDKRTEKQKTIKDLIKEAIRQVNRPGFKSFKKLIESGIEIETEILDTIDASEFVKQHLPISLGFKNRNDFFNEYLNYLVVNNQLETHFPEFYKLLFE